MGWQDETIAGLRRRAPEMRAQWTKPAPFPYLVVDDFLPREAIASMLREYPSPDAPSWIRKTYAHQREKLAMPSGFPAAFADYFDLTADPGFRKVMEEITGLSGLLPDAELLGGGLHQLTQGGFLDIHVDFNLHPKTKLHRRLNLLLYLNEGWREEYEGHLELWDMSKPERIDRIAPVLNRAVMFETNEVSYHGHPTPLACPPDVTRKSLAMYYYTETRDGGVVAAEHSTLYRQTTGVRGYVKTALASAVAAREVLRAEGIIGLGHNVGDKVYRKLRGLPPRNR